MRRNDGWLNALAAGASRGRPVHKLLAGDGNEPYHFCHLTPHLSQRCISYLSPHIQLSSRQICQWCYPKLPKVIAVRAYATVLNDARASCHKVSALLSSFRYFVAEHVHHIWERLGLASLSQCKHIRVPEASGDPESGKACGLSILQILPLPSNILFILSTGSSCRCTQSSPCPTHLELPKCQLSLHSLHCSFSLALRFPAMLLGRHATSVRSTGYVITTSLV